MSEVSVLLKMLDQESLSSSAEEKKTSVWNLLQQIQPQGEEVSVNADRVSGFSKDLSCSLLAGIGSSSFYQAVQILISNKMNKSIIFHIVSTFFFSEINKLD